MMFQGSANAPKMQHIKLINSSGGVLNGSTSYDVTNYYEAVPSNALERVLWLEADRMRALKVDDENLRNQRDVVKEEVRVNVMNQPYGGFPWLDMPRWRFAIGRTRTISTAILRSRRGGLEGCEGIFQHILCAEQRRAAGTRRREGRRWNFPGEKVFQRYSGRSGAAIRDPSEPEQTEERRGNVEENSGRYRRWRSDT